MKTQRKRRYILLIHTLATNTSFLIRRDANCISLIREYLTLKQLNLTSPS